MRLIDPDVPRERIDAGIRAAVHPRHDPARWALPLLDELDRTIDGVWQRVALDEEAFDALWLPEHTGEPCHGDSHRLGDAPGGSSLRDAAAWLTAHGDVYAAANPSCWGRIIAASRQPSSPIVVADRSVGDRLKPDDAALVVVDGLHRALGYRIDGRRTCEAYIRRAVGNR